MACDPVNVNASQSTFNEVGRDQTINHFTYFIYASQPPPGLEQTLPHPSDLSWPASSSNAISRGNDLISTYHTSEDVSVVDITTDLIEKIVQLLISGESWDKIRNLKLELELLHLTLFSTRSAIQIFKDTPLDQSVANTINPTVWQCFIILQEVFDHINCYRDGVLSTTINFLWLQVCLNGLDMGKLGLLRLKLSACRESLDGFLMALSSYVSVFNAFPPTEGSHSTKKYSVEWTKFGNQLPRGLASVHTFSACLKQRLPFLHHIPLNAVRVVDHLGQNIPVPTLFCSTWEVCRYHFVRVLIRSHIPACCRILAILSTATAKIGSEIASSRGVTTK